MLALISVNKFPVNQANWLNCFAPYGKYRKRLLSPDMIALPADVIGETFTDFAIWCANLFPKLIDLVKGAIPGTPEPRTSATLSP